MKQGKEGLKIIKKEMIYVSDIFKIFDEIFCKIIYTI
jgi:hypothetical protein